MKELPILFSAPMVRAILDNRKTQTRRAVNFERARMCGERVQVTERGYKTVTATGIEDVPWTAERLSHLDCPYGKPGDRLWVREGWKIGAWRQDGRMAVDYLATPEITNTPWVYPDEQFERYWRESTDDLIRAGLIPGSDGFYHWKPGKAPTRRRNPRFMPRWASRITLQITELRVQRLQEISEEDCKAEGVELLKTNCDGECGTTPCGISRQPFIHLWESINGAASWDENPWVWAITFRRVTDGSSK